MKEITQQQITQRYMKWQEKHPNHPARRIDKIGNLPIEGNKYYYATRTGFVISFYDEKPRLLKWDRPIETKFYAKVRLRIGDGDYCKTSVHRIIMETYADEMSFLPPREGSTPLKKYCAHHIECKFVDVEKYADIFEGMTENEKQAYSRFYDNSVENLQGLEKKYHDTLHSLTDEEDENMGKIRDLNLYQPTIIITGKPEDSSVDDGGKMYKTITCTDEQLQALLQEILKMNMIVSEK